MSEDKTCCNSLKKLKARLGVGKGCRAGKPGEFFSMWKEYSIEYVVHTHTHSHKLLEEMRGIKGKKIGCEGWVEKL